MTRTFALLRTSGLAALALAALATPAQAFLGFGKPKPAGAAAVPNAKTPDAKPAAEAAPRKANAEERAAAERLDPLSRAAFWTREQGLDPADAQAGISLSAALRAMGRFPEAAQAAQQVLVVQPNNYAALMQVAQAHVGANRGFYALEFLKRAQAVLPSDWRAVSLEGVALEQSERLAEARAAYDRALKLSPGNPAVLSNIAMSYAAHGEIARSEQLLRQATASPAATIQTRQNLALVLGLQGKLAEAEGLMRRDLPPEIANNNLAYLRGASSAGGRSWAAVKGAEAAAQR